MVCSDYIILFVKSRELICPFYIIVRLVLFAFFGFFFPTFQILGIKVFRQFLAIRPRLYYPVYINAIKKFCHRAIPIFENPI